MSTPELENTHVAHHLEWSWLLPLISIGLLGLAQVWVYWRFFFEAYPLIPFYNIPLMDGGKISGWQVSAAIQQGTGYILLFLCYYAAYHLSTLWFKHFNNEQSAPWVHHTFSVFIYGVPALASLILFYTYPFTAADIFQNIVSARVLSVFGNNPLIIPPNQLPDPYLPYIPFPNLPTPYGPLWNLTSAFTAFLAGNDLLRLIFVFKAWTLIWYFVSIFLVKAIMDKVRPSMAQPNVLFFAWNPLLLLEVACNAHNDIMMVGLMLLAFYLLVRDRPMLSLLALTASMLVKYLTILLFPLIILYILTNARFGMFRERVIQTVTGLALSAMLALLCYLPFLTNASIDLILTGLRIQSDFATTSLARLARIRLRGFTGLTEDMTWDIIKRVLIGIFALFYLPQLWRATRGFMHMIGACYTAFWLYLIFAAFWFQPWYLIWIIGLAAIWPGLGRHDDPITTDDQMLAARTTLYSLSALLTYVIFYFSGLYGNRIGEGDWQAWAFVIAHAPVVVLALLQAPTLWKATYYQINSSKH